MAGPKFFIHGGRRWREIDSTSGSVAGWGKVQFLYVQCGRLQVARKSSVLRGLRSLAASKPTSVHDGLPLSQIRHPDAIENTNAKEHDCVQYHHHCCCRKQDLRYNADAIFNNLIKAVTNTAAVQCNLSEVNTCVQPKPSTSTSLSPSKRIANITKYNHNEEKRLLGKRKHSTSDDETEGSRKIQSTKCREIETDSDIECLSLSDGESSPESVKKAPLRSVNSTKYNKIKLGKSKISRKLSSSENEIQETSPRLRKSQRLNHENRDVLPERSPFSQLIKERQNKLGKASRKILTNDDVIPKKLNKSPKKIQENHVKTSTQVKERTTRNSLKNSTYIIPDKQQLRRSKRKLSISEDEAEVRKVGKTHRNIGVTSTQRQTQESENDLCKELLIGEDDVLLLRTFIERDEANIFRVDLEKFDSDDNYKGLIFYKLNPLVNIVRCKQIAAMLREQNSPSNTVSFEDFISNLGLRSVLDSSSQSSSKYKMRPRRTKDVQSQNTNRTVQHSSESELDKENFKKSKRDHSKTSNNKILVESVRDIGNKKNRIISKKVKKHAVGLVGKMSSKPQRSRQDSTNVLSVSSDSDSVFEKSKQSVQSKQSERNKQSVQREQNKGSERNKQSEQKKQSKHSEQNKQDEQRLKPTVALKRRGGASGREYTRAEDEALVSWVRGAGRARRVNGNQLWRELQSEHQRRTGQFRSWHSLRNRYLRYVLPALGSLALPPHEAARLRADAAAGEIKSRKKPQRRKTLLAEPRVVSAWSRRPRSPPRESPSHSRSPSPSRSPSHPRTRTISLPTRKDTSSDSYTPTEIDGDDSDTSMVSRDVWKAKVQVNKSSRQLRSSDISSNKEKDILSYSLITRRFADKPSPSSSDVTRRNTHTDTQADAHTDRQKDTHRRTRRLYNPKAM